MGILRQIFGPSREEVWKQLCNELGGTLVKGKLLPHRCKARIQVKDWTVTFDTYKKGKRPTFTRIRAPYVNKDGFRFTIYNRTLLSDLGKALGMQDVVVGGPKFENLAPLCGVPSYVDPYDIEIGEPEFDNEFIIKGNNEEKIRQLFSNIKIRDLMQSQPSIFLQVKDDEGFFGDTFPAGVDELYFQTPGVIKDIERLKSLYYLIAEVLNMLCHIGSAYEDDPKLLL